MKKYKMFTIFAFALSAFILESCYYEDDSWVDISNPQNIQNGLRIENTQTENGKLPQSTPGNNNLSSSISSIKVDADGIVLLPLIYSGGHDIKKVYFQVPGATGYFSVTPYASCSAGGSAYVVIKIPKMIDDGKFVLSYLVQDASGSYSNAVKSLIYITNDVVDCDTYVEGQQGLTFTTVSLGNKSGEVSIYYNTYTVPDRIDVYQGTTWITGMGANPNCPIPPMCYCNNVLPGFRGESGYLTFNYNASKGKAITVVVSGCLNGGTQWAWYLDKSPNCTSSYSSVNAAKAAASLGKLKEEEASH